MHVLQARQRRIGSPRATFSTHCGSAIERAAERDEIGLAAGDGRFRQRRIAEPADGNHRHVDLFFHLGGEVEKRAIGHRHRRQHDLRRRQRAIMSRSDMQRVGAALRRPERDLPAFGERQAAGKEVFDRQPVDHAQVRHRRLHGTQNFQTEAGAIFQAAAVFVVAPVLERRMELRDQIAVCGVDFDAIEAGLLRALRGGDMGGDGLHDARLGHRFRNDGLERGLVDRMRNGRRRDRRLAANVDRAYGRRRGRAGSTPWRRRGESRRRAASGPE